MQPATHRRRRLTGPGGAVAGATAYDAAVSHRDVHARRRARRTRPTYTATVSGAKDTAGNTMAAGQLVLHHRRAAARRRSTSGPGGPILVVSTSAPTASSPRYTAEILRAEGLNEFATIDLSDVDRGDAGAATTSSSSADVR